MIDARTLRERMDARLARPRSGRVILRRCPEARPDAVRGIVEESFRDLGIAPRGRVFIKPNVVTANRRYIRHSYTDPKIVAEVIRHVKKNGADEVTVGESSGFGIPTRLFLREAGYLRLASAGAKIVDLNTEPYVTVPLARGMHHKEMRVSESLAEADTLIWMPKLKYHICCQVTCSIKLNIGILRHSERLLYHDDRLDEKIADLLEVGYPDAVVVDAVTVGSGYESAPRGLDLGALLVSDDPVAMDLVACRLLNFTPERVAHLMESRRRGYGPANVEDVRVEGDVTIEELAARTAGHESEYQDIQKVNTPIKFYTGTDPDRGRLCHGGCLAAVKGCLGTIDARRPGSVARAKGGAIVTGVVDGDVDAGDGVVLLVGSCTTVKGKITARKVRRVKGCTVGTKHLLTAVPYYFRMPSPLFDVRDAVLFLTFSIDKWIRRLRIKLAFAK
ncbi:MAG: DUF362 domain-containing protein [Deltaproteobacteria bacterium]|nr:DUF362 domain-containing protein [Deltaproteobacteria bacterium]